MKSVDVMSYVLYLLGSLCFFFGTLLSLLSKIAPELK